MSDEVCIVCKESEEWDWHHIIPISEGGPKDGPQVRLCPVCHRKIHLLANDVFKGKTERLESFKPEEMDRVIPLVQAIVSSKIRNESSGKPHSSISRLMIEIPFPLMVKLHQRKRDLGFSSLQKFLIALFERETETL